MAKRVLFVCMGNICRSPAGEGIFRRMVSERGLEDEIEIDSAGTLGYHTGELPDSRMRAAAKKRGYVLDSHARQIQPNDFEKFDLILLADYENLRDVNRVAGAKAAAGKIKLVASYCTKHPQEEVPDPYYGDGAGFELVLDLLEDACANLLLELAPKT